MVTYWLITVCEDGEEVGVDAQDDAGAAEYEAVQSRLQEPQRAALEETHVGAETKSIRWKGRRS